MIAWTRLRLAQWGRWCRGVHRTGYPTASAFVHANEGDRCKYAVADMPADLQEIEDLVNSMSHLLRQPVIAFYVRTGPLWLRAAQIGTSRRTLLRRVRTAEEWIDRNLTASVDTRPENTL